MGQLKVEKGLEKNKIFVFYYYVTAILRGTTTVLIFNWLLIKQLNYIHLYYWLSKESYTVELNENLHYKFLWELLITPPTPTSTLKSVDFLIKNVKKSINVVDLKEVLTEIASEVIWIGFLWNFIWWFNLIA